MVTLEQNSKSTFFIFNRQCKFYILINLSYRKKTASINVSINILFYGVKSAFITNSSVARKQFTDFPLKLSLCILVLTGFVDK